MAVRLNVSYTDTTRSNDIVPIIDQFRWEMDWLPKIRAHKLNVLWEITIGLDLLEDPQCFASIQEELGVLQAAFEEDANLSASTVNEYVSRIENLKGAIAAVVENRQSVSSAFIM